MAKSRFNPVADRPADYSPRVQVEDHGVADVLGVSRSNLHNRLTGGAKPRRSYHRAQDAAVLPRIERLVAKRRPTAIAGSRPF